MRAIILVAFTAAAALALPGCADKTPPMTVAEFLENEAALYATLARCQDNPALAAEPECRNARQAAERISVIEERAMRRARDQAFESAREEFRARLDRERQLREQAEAEAEAARLQALTEPAEEADTDAASSHEPADPGVPPVEDAPDAERPPELQ